MKTFEEKILIKERVKSLRKSLEKDKNTQVEWIVKISKVKSLIAKSLVRKENPSQALDLLLDLQQEISDNTDPFWGSISRLQALEIEIQGELDE